MVKRMIRKISQAALISAATTISCGNLVNRPPEIEPAHHVLIEKAPRLDLQKNPISHLLWRRTTETKAHITITKTGRFAIGMPSPRFLADGYAESFVRVDVVLSAKIDPIEKSVSIVSRHKSGDEKTCSISIDSEGLNPTIIGVESARGVDFYILPTDQGQMIIENGKINAQLIEVTYSTIARYDSEHPAADGRTKQFEAGDLSGMQILSREVRMPAE